MKIKQTILMISLFIAINVFSVSPIASAVTTCNDGSGGTYTTLILPCGGTNDGKDIKNSDIWVLLITAINILSAGVGIAAVGGIVYGSILYTTAGGSMEETKIAKKLILNVVFGIVAYALMFSLLNFIIPGGLFSA